MAFRKRKEIFLECSVDSTVVGCHFLFAPRMIMTLYFLHAYDVPMKSTRNNIKQVWLINFIY
jgi:hypothetical protein